MGKKFKTFRLPAPKGQIIPAETYNDIAAMLCYMTDPAACSVTAITEKQVAPVDRKPCEGFSITLSLTVGYPLLPCSVMKVGLSHNGFAKTIL